MRNDRVGSAKDQRPGLQKRSERGAMLYTVVQTRYRARNPQIMARNAGRGTGGGGWRRKENGSYPPPHPSKLWILSIRLKLLHAIIRRSGGEAQFELEIT